MTNMHNKTILTPLKYPKKLKTSQEKPLFFHPQKCFYSPKISKLKKLSMAKFSSNQGGGNHCKFDIRYRSTIKPRPAKHLRLYVIKCQVSDFCPRRNATEGLSNGLRSSVRASVTFLWTQLLGNH